MSSERESSSDQTSENEPSRMSDYTSNEETIIALKVLKNSYMILLLSLLLTQEEFLS
jgi:hypothetical protein